MNPSPEEIAENLNESATGWVLANGMTFLRVAPDEVRARMEIRPEHLQAYGIVHGGIYCALIETTASVGAAIEALRAGRAAVGLENNTSFLRAVRGGTLFAHGTPLVKGRTSHVWNVHITDDQGRLAATGRVRMLCLEPEDRTPRTPSEGSAT